MMNFGALLAGTAMAALSANVARAQDVTYQPGATQQFADASQAMEAGDIVVLGFGQSRQVQSVTAVDIARLTPGSTPLKAVEKLPGVNFQSADPFGAYEWSTRISLRGFNQNQLGFTLDDVPLGDMSYGNYNGLHVSRAIISENVATVNVAQGAGAVGTASTSNLGGTLQFVSRAPSDKFEVAGSGTYGSNNTFRGFARLDSGLIGDKLKASLSYAYLKADKWKGDGEQRQHQVNAKVVADLGDAGSIAAWANYSDRRENDYQDLSKEMINRLGYDWDNISDNYALALRVGQIVNGQAAGPLPAPLQSPDDAYFDAAGLRKDVIGGVTFDAHLTENLSLKTTGYYHHNKGQGIWFTPYVPTPGGAPLSVRTTEYTINRAGAVSRLALTTGSNRLEVGGWYESNAFHQARRYYGLANQSTPSRDSLDFQSNPFRTDWDFDFDTETMQYYVQDTLELGPLTINGGWKGFKVNNSAHPIVAGSLPSGDIEARDWFLPQIGAVYKFTGNAELFANFTQNMRAFVSAATSGPFSTTQAGFNAISNNLKPERSDSYEAGGRLRAGPLQASIAGYYIDFTNRQLAVQVGAGILGNPPVLQNVGRVRSYGLETAATVKLTPVLSLFGSYSYNKAEYRDNVLSGTVLTLTKGKTVVDTPKHMLKGEIVYDDNQFLARVGADYMSKRFFTYLNDQSVSSRVLVDATIGYHFSGEGFLSGVAIEGSVTNLTDKKYVSTVGSNGFGNSGDNQTLLAGSPRQFFVTVRKGF